MKKLSFGVVHSIRVAVSIVPNCNFLNRKRLEFADTLYNRVTFVFALSSFLMKKKNK